MDIGKTLVMMSDMSNANTALAATDAARYAVSLTVTACGGRPAPESASALRLDALVYACLREELGLTRLPRATREAFDATVAAELAAHNRAR